MPLQQLPAPPAGSVHPNWPAPVQAARVHTPATQLAPVGHAAPHPPQLAGSDSMAAQLPLQQSPTSAPIAVHPKPFAQGPPLVPELVVPAVAPMPEEELVPELAPDVELVVEPVLELEAAPLVEAAVPMVGELPVVLELVVEHASSMNSELIQLRRGVMGAPSSSR